VSEQEKFLATWSERFVNPKLGFSTATSSPVPAHSLNRFLAAFFDPEANQHDLALSLVHRNHVQISELEAKCAELGLALPTSIAELAEIRRVSSGLIASDGKVFPSSQTFQVAHSALVSADRSGGNAPRLAALMVAGHPEGLSSVKEFSESLSLSTDHPHWLIEAVVAPDPVPKHQIQDPSVGLAPDWMSLPESQALRSSIAELIIATLDSYAGADPIYAARQLSMAVHWSAILMFVNLSDILFEAEAKSRIVVAAGLGSDKPSVVNASNSSFQHVVNVFRAWRLGLMNATVRNNIGLAEEADGHGEETKIRDWLGDLAPRETSKQVSLVYRKITELFDSFNASPQLSPVSAASEALLDAIDASSNTSPSDWLANQSRTCGFGAPRRGPAKRRFTVDPALLRVISLAGFERDEEALEWSRWEDRLLEKFGCILGPRHIREISGIKPTARELELNRTELARQLGESGLAITYSDSVTQVLNPNARVGVSPHE
jgi:hypothetical protein